MHQPPCLDHAKSCQVLLYNILMRNTRTLSVTLPPDMLKRAQSIAKKESRTMSELIREALRHYERRSHVSSMWADVNAYGRAQAARQDIREQDVDRMVHEARASTRANKRAPRKPVAKLIPAEKPADDLFGYMAGKVKIVGDIVGPATPLEDWESK